MRRFARLIWPGGLLLLGGCDVQLRNTTLAEYPANHDIGMYEVSVAVTRDALVTSGSVYVFAQGAGAMVTLTPNADDSECRGL